jgi:predicted PurR-regulated permease PerM
MINETPIVKNVTPWLHRLGIDLENEGRNLIGKLGQAAMSFAQGSLAAAIQTLVTVFLLYCLLHDPTTFVRGLRALLPLSHAEEDHVFEHAIDSIYGNLFATLVTSVIDCATGGLLFYLVGVPSPFLWTAVMFVLSLMPILGAGMVWVPMIVSLLLAGKWGAALAIAVWGALTFTLVDNLLFARLTGKRMRMHPALALVGFLGGVVLFGAAGMILGPVILAVTIAVLDIWKRRAQKPAPG